MRDPVVHARLVIAVEHVAVDREMDAVARVDALKRRSRARLRDEVEAASQALAALRRRESRFLAGMTSRRHCAAAGLPCALGPL